MRGKRNILLETEILDLAEHFFTNYVQTEKFEKKIADELNITHLQS